MNHTVPVQQSRIWDLYGPPERADSTATLFHPSISRVRRMWMALASCPAEFTRDLPRLELGVGALARRAQLGVGPVGGRV